MSVALTLPQAWRARCEAQPGKAMVVAYSRRIAAELTGLLQERLGEEAVTCVISAQATDEREISRFRRSKAPWAISASTSARRRASSSISRSGRTRIRAPSAPRSRCPAA